MTNTIARYYILSSAFTKSKLVIIKNKTFQVCQAIGWNSIHQGPLNVMVSFYHTVWMNDVLQIISLWFIYSSDVDPHWFYADPKPQNFMNPGQSNHQIDFTPSFKSREKKVFSNLYLSLEISYFLRFRLEKHNVLWKKILVD